MHGSVICLRKQLAKSRAKPERLHRLAACILCATPEELRRAANWPGAGPASRQRVIEELQVVSLWPSPPARPHGALHVSIRQSQAHIMMSHRVLLA